MKKLLLRTASMLIIQCRMPPPLYIAEASLKPVLAVPEAGYWSLGQSVAVMGDGRTVY